MARDDDRPGRGHTAKQWPPVPLPHFRSVQITVGAEETYGLGIGPARVRIESPSVNLSAEEARQVASYLLEAADQVDAINA